MRGVFSVDIVTVPMRGGVDVLFSVPIAVLAIGDMLVAFEPCDRMAAPCGAVLADVVSGACVRLGEVLAEVMAVHDEVITSSIALAIGTSLVVSSCTETFGGSCTVDNLAELDVTDSSSYV